MSEAAEISMFEFAWFGRGPAFWRWVKTLEAKPYIEAFMDMHRRPNADEPFDLLGDDDKPDILDPHHLKVLARNVEARFGTGQV